MTEHQARGKLIVFEGPDNVGKTTLATHLTERLREAGVQCEQLAFPGHLPGSLGRLVYDLHHEAARSGFGEINTTSLQVLHIAAHIDAIEQHILPTLRAGSWIVLDRFWWSTWVYGGAHGAREESLQKMIELEQIHWGRIKPDVLFVVERKSGATDDGNQLRDRYRRLAQQEQHYVRIVTLCNELSIQHAVDEAWEAIASTTNELTKRRDVAAAAPTGELPLPEVSTPPQPLRLFSRVSPAMPTEVYDTYWRFAAERQEVFFRRLRRSAPPWTDDPILARFKFTNAYRASDRVSQYLIRNVIYRGLQSSEEIFFRILLFKVFNKIETWERLESALGAIEYSSYSFDAYDGVLTRELADGRPIYSAAYIMPSPSRAFGYSRKHRNHLKLIEQMMSDEVPYRIAEMHTMQKAFALLRSYPSIGDFLAYQFVTDLNYSEVTAFSEMEFVVPGPGARDGIRKCFADLGGLSEADLIRVVTERQQEEFDRLGLQFRDLWGRSLQLIDCQNLFCEVAKYARVKHPDVEGIGNRSRIKQIYRPTAESVMYWYPPKWGINRLIPRGASHV